ncbi:UNVERIFIED_CONTAM: hypothetical protein K2H54_076096 [Gekko kuhli]
MVYSTSTSASKSTSHGGARSSPKAPKVTVRTAGRECEVAIKWSSMSKQPLGFLGAGQSGKAAAEPEKELRVRAPPLFVVGAVRKSSTGYSL